MGLWRILLHSSPRLVRLVSQQILASLRLRQLLVHVVMFMAVTAMLVSPSDEVQCIILVLTCGWVLWLSFVVNHTNRTLDISESVFEYWGLAEYPRLSENLKSVFNCSTGSSWSFGIVMIKVMVGLSWSIVRVIEAFSFSPASQYDNVASKLKTIVAVQGICPVPSYVGFPTHFGFSNLAF